MDGQATNHYGVPGPDEATGDLGEQAPGDHLRESDLEVASIEGGMEQMRMLDDDVEQPDGQRSSLSLDDDGGTHFESHSQETVVRRGGPVRDVNAVSPTLQEGSDDNDVVFNPAQRLDFDDDDEDEEDDDDDDNNDNEDGVQVPVNIEDNAAIGNRQFLQHRPILHGSDMAENRASGGAPSAADQGQNIRIIEGHDSSLLDDGGNSAYGFNFLQTQMIQMPLMSPVNTGMAYNSGMEDETHNLYDSLEREDGSSPYGEAHGAVMESNTSEYFSAGSVSLMVANSQGPESDTLWAQDEGSDHGGYFSHAQLGHGDRERNRPRHQSPPRNFQVDTSSLFAAAKRGSGFLGEGNMGGYGDVHRAEEDNTDSHSIELSEEGLLHNTQMYAQPVSTSGATMVGTIASISTGRIDGGLSHQSPLEWTSNRLPANSNNQNNVFESTANKSSPVGASNSPPKNSMWNQGLPQDEATAAGHVTGDGVDMLPDERQAGAGSSSSATDQKPAADIKTTKKGAGGKIQTRRPAVQGSASSDDSKRIGGGANPRPGSSVPVRKTAPMPRSGNQGDAGGRGSSSASSQKTGGEPSKVNSSVASAAGNAQSRQPQGQASTASQLSSRANSHTSLASNASSTNSRVSGVGKESHTITNTQTSSARGACQLIVGTESSHSASMAHRQDTGISGKGDAAQSSNQNAQPSQSDASISQAYPQSSQSFDRARPPAGQHQTDPITSQSFTKQRMTNQNTYHLQNISGHDEHSSDTVRSSDMSQLPPRPVDGQTRRNAGAGGGSVSSQNQNQFQQQGQYHHMQHHPPNQPLAFGHQQLALQRNHAGFPLQSNYSQGASPSGSEGSHHSLRENVVTQMDALKRQGHRLSPNESNSHRSLLDNDIQGMEEVRSHLHSMLRMGAEASMTEHVGHDHTDSATDLLLSEQPINRQLYFDSDSSSFVGNNPQDDMSEILENFPTFSSKMFSDMSAMSHRSTAAAHGENQYLRDCLEKEKYRRKHCEEHIQKLNTKLLETQQQLAVAVSTDKRKDIMIEQLDKQLAKVVEGWKKRESEKDEFLKAMSHEKEQIEETLQSQQTMINNFERELAETVEELRGEKEKSAEKISSLKNELYEANHAREHMEQVLEAEREKFSEMTVEWDDLKNSRDLAEKRAQQAQERLIQEQDNWQKKEQEYQAKISEVKEANQHVINMEKVKVEEQKKKREDAEAQSEELKAELKKAILDLEQLVREKESQKVEMAIMEAKAESAQRKLEADLHAQMEKEIADQASEFHARIESSLEEAAERHRRQVSELHSRHQRDLERHTASLNEDRQKKEDEYRKQIMELEEKLQEMRSENTALKQSKVKLESQRMEILTKLQFMMQSQWNEAVSLLVSTPQKKSLNSSFLSSQSGGQLASAMAVTDGNTSVTSLNLVSSGPPAAVAQGSEGQSRENAASSPRPSAASAAVVENGEDRRHDEVDRMDRVEEYLQRLTHHMDIPMTRNDLQVTEMNQGTRSSPSVVTVSSSRTGATYNYSNTGTQHQQHQQQHLSSSEHGSSVGSGKGNDFQDKPSNNLTSSQMTHVHGYVTGQSGKTLITTSGHLGGGHLAASEPRFQAVAMRSPQQSSSRFSVDSSHTSAKAGSNHQSAPANHPYLPGSQSDIGVAPTHRPQHHPSSHYQAPHHQHPHHQEQHLTQYSPQRAQQQQQLPPHRQQQQQQQYSSSFMSLTNTYSTDELRPSAGDFGDHKDVKQVSSSAANINLYSPDSPTYTSSPAGIRSDQWSPGDIGASRHYSGTTLMMTGMLSPSRGAMGRPADGMESPVKRHRPRTNQQLSKNADRLNDSLSPPVKQTAERDHGDNMSEASSGFHDPNRMQANYSHLSDRMEEHQNRQGELQHYVKMLLQKAPGSVCSEPERDIHSDHDILESSRELTVDLDLNDTATAVELTSQLARLQHLREQQTSRTHQGQNRNPSKQQQQQHLVRVNQSNDRIPGHLTEFIGDNGVISTEGLSEISQLLNLYRDQWENNPEMAGQANVASQLMDALKDMATGAGCDQVSSKDDKKSAGTKNSPRSQQTRKVRDLGRTRKSRSGSQSADSSLAIPADSLDKSNSGRGGNHGQPTRKVAGTQQAEGQKEKKMGAGKQAGGKGGGGPVWK